MQYWITPEETTIILENYNSKNYFNCHSFSDYRNNTEQQPEHLNSGSNKEDQQPQHHHLEQQSQQKLLVPSYKDYDEVSSSDDMPSRQMNDSMLAKNVEELVHEIKENLRLKARPSHSHGRNSRPSPYPPCRSWNDQQNNASSNIAFGESTTTTSTTCLQQQTQHTTTTATNFKNRFGKKVDSTSDIDDPYELLQALLQSNNLVKEAVRRLQLNNGNLTKRKLTYYDSDDESSCSPRMFKLCQLEL